MQLEALQNTVAKKQPVQSGQLNDDQKLNIPQTLKIDCETIKNGGNNHWIANVVSHGGWWFFYKPHVDVFWGNLITEYHFKNCFPYARRGDINKHFEPFNQTLAEFEINTVQRIAAFCAQIAHESGSLRYSEELASGAAYEGRRDLGNVQAGDGRKYKGRGLIQLTGRHNYGWASKELGVDLVHNPELAARPEYSSRIAGLYWHSRNLNKYADMHSEHGFKIITRKINGGTNGWSDRLKYWRIAKKVLCC